MWQFIALNILNLKKNFSNRQTTKRILIDVQKIIIPSGKLNGNATRRTYLTVLSAIVVASIVFFLNFRKIVR